jgi:hypothetical protein
LIAIHARVRDSFERASAGARDGRALLDQVARLKKDFADRILITNGNTITYDDVVKNLNHCLRFVNDKKLARFKFLVAPSIASTVSRLIHNIGWDISEDPFGSFCTAWGLGSPIICAKCDPSEVELVVVGRRKTSK